MSSPSSTESRSVLRGAWPMLGALALLAACSQTPERPAPTAATPVAPAATPGASSGAPANATAPVEPPARAVVDFDRALGMMRAGNTTEAELEFQQISVAYPQFVGPDINLGILYRKTGQLERAEKALRVAVEHNSSNAVAWNELGVTMRMRGEFRDAADAYNKAIAADANFAPAYRNLGVLLDLYLNDAPGALTALEHYKQLSGEEKPVNGWIAELRQRAGKTAPPGQGASPGGQSSSPPAQGAPPSGPGAAPSAQGAASPGQATPQPVQPQAVPSAQPSAQSGPGTAGQTGTQRSEQPPAAPTGQQPAQAREPGKVGE